MFLGSASTRDKSACYDDRQSNDRRSLQLLFMFVFHSELNSNQAQYNQLPVLHCKWSLGCLSKQWIVQRSMICFSRKIPSISQESKYHPSKRQLFATDSGSLSRNQNVSRDLTSISSSLSLMSRRKSSHSPTRSGSESSVILKLALPSKSGTGYRLDGVISKTTWPDDLTTAWFQISASNTPLFLSLYGSSSSQ